MQIVHPHSGSSSTWYLVELAFGNVGFWEEGKTGVPGEKPLEARWRTNNKLNPHMASTPGFEPGPHWWEASALTTALPLLPRKKPWTLSYSALMSSWSGPVDVKKWNTSDLTNLCLWPPCFAVLDLGWASCRKRPYYKDYLLILLQSRVCTLTSGTKVLGHT